MSATLHAVDGSHVRGKVSQEEWEARVELAACYRLVAHMGWTDLIYTHISRRVPGPDHHFLINPYGFGFDEITASSLVKIDLDGNPVMDTPYEVNKAGYVIHSAIHGAREDAACVLHTHTVAGMAVCAQPRGLLPISQHAMMFYNRIGHHDYEGIATDVDERTRLVNDLGPHQAMLLRNHGLLTTGGSCASAFTTMYYLEKACAAQVAAQAGGQVIELSHEVAEHTAQQYDRGGHAGRERPWPSLIRMLDRMGSDYAT
ncbi:MAG: class II aldolase/adducin family protein [Alphaproteobacteria bacterium]|nr:class II aldolase/adducin family protein [Alphaproteobacteria bacterium]